MKVTVLLVAQMRRNGVKSTPDELVSQDRDDSGQAASVKTAVYACGCDAPQRWLAFVAMSV